MGTERRSAACERVSSSAWGQTLYLAAAGSAKREPLRPRKGVIIPPVSLENIDAAAELIDLEPAEIRRYGRHLTLPELGIDGQKRLKAARVLLVGAGGLGSPLGLYLAAAGVGTLGLVDFDRVDESNLQRQVLYGHSDVGRPKIDVALERLREINPLISLEPHQVRLDAGNAMNLVDAYDVVVDGSDNFPTRYLINDACVLAGKPNVWGAISRFEGQVAVFWAQRGSCYRCLFPEPPPPGLVPSCAEGGVLGVLPGIIGSLQANEVIKLIAGLGEPLIGRLVIFDALRMRFRELKVDKSEECPSCGPRAELTELVEFDAAPCDAGDEATDPRPPGGDTKEQRMADPVEPPFEIDVEQLKAWADEDLGLHIIDVREPHEHAICRIDGARLLPMRQIPQSLDEIDRDVLTVVHCHHGPRSAQVVAYLRQQGFDRVTNLGGGIDAWSLRRSIRTIPRY